VKISFQTTSSSCFPRLQDASRFCIGPSAKSTEVFSMSRPITFRAPSQNVATRPNAILLSPEQQPGCLNLRPMQMRHLPVRRPRTRISDRYFPPARNPPPIPPLPVLNPTQLPGGLAWSEDPAQDDISFEQLLTADDPEPWEAPSNLRILQNPSLVIHGSEFQAANNSSLYDFGTDVSIETEFAMPGAPSSMPGLQGPSNQIPLTFDSQPGDNTFSFGLGDDATASTDTSIPWAEASNPGLREHSDPTLPVFRTRAGETPCLYGPKNDSQTAVGAPMQWAIPTLPGLYGPMPRMQPDLGYVPGFYDTIPQPQSAPNFLPAQLTQPRTQIPSILVHPPTPPTHSPSYLIETNFKPSITTPLDPALEERIRADMVGIRLASATDDATPKSIETYVHQWNDALRTKPNLRRFLRIDNTDPHIRRLPRVGAVGSDSDTETESDLGWIYTGEGNWNDEFFQDLDLDRTGLEHAPEPTTPSRWSETIDRFVNPVHITGLPWKGKGKEPTCVPAQSAKGEERAPNHTASSSKSTTGRSNQMPRTSTPRLSKAWGLKLNEARNRNPEYLTSNGTWTHRLASDQPETPCPRHPTAPIPIPSITTPRPSVSTSTSRMALTSADNARIYFGPRSHRPQTVPASSPKQIQKRLFEASHSALPTPLRPSTTIPKRPTLLIPADETKPQFLGPAPSPAGGRQSSKESEVESSSTNPNRSSTQMQRQAAPITDREHHDVLVLQTDAQAALDAPREIEGLRRIILQRTSKTDEWIECRIVAL
jgi:hypothetical protein